MTAQNCEGRALKPNGHIDIRTAVIGGRYEERQRVDSIKRPFVTETVQTYPPMHFKDKYEESKTETRPKVTAGIRIMFNCY